MIETNVPTILISALTLGGLGCVIAYLILFGFNPQGKSDLDSLVISSGAAAFGMSYLFWRLLCVPDHLISTRRGVLVGVLTGLFAHPVAWYLAIVWNYLAGATSSLGDRAVNPLEDLAACFVYAFWSNPADGMAHGFSRRNRRMVPGEGAATPLTSSSERQRVYESTER